MNADQACMEYVPLLVRAGEGTLATNDLRRLEAHAEHCAACREAWVAQRQMHVVLSALPATMASSGFSLRVQREIAREDRAAWWDRLDFRRWTWRLVPVPVALALLALFSGGTRAVPEVAILDTPPASVSSALWSTDTSPDDVMSLLLFAEPDASLPDALQEVAQ